MPDPAEESLEGNKKTAYEKAALQEEPTKGRMLSLSEFAGELLKPATEGTAGTAQQSAAAPTPEENIRQSAETYKQVNAQLSDFYKPTKEQEQTELAQKVDQLLSRLETEDEIKAQQQRQEQMMERSYQMAAQYLNPQAGQLQQVATPVDKAEVTPVTGVSAQTTSSLPQQSDSQQILEDLSVRRNFGFNTAVGTSYQMGANTIPACIDGDQTLINGQRVRLRILQAIQAGAVTIPAGSLVTGSASIQGERLDIQIQNLEYGGNIIPVEMAVYDIDGQRGIFVPGSESRSAVKDAVADIGSNMGNSVSITHSAGQQVAMDLSRGIIQSGTQLLSKKIRTVQINLKTGHKVLLVPKRNS